MDGLRSYIISVVAVALISGIVSRLVNEAFTRELIRLLCNFFLVITILSPLLDWKFEDISDFSVFYFQDAQAISEAGKQNAQAVMAEHIIEQSEAYILDKAATWGTDLSVDITLDEQFLPEYAMLGGEVPPHFRKQLEVILEKDLGITKENQVWTG